MAHTDVSSGVSPMVEMVESFAQLVGKEGRNLTSSQIELVRSLNATFYNQTLPTIASRHKNDVALLKAHVRAIEQCNTDLANNSLKAASLKRLYDAASSASTTCAGQEAAALNASTSASTAMSAFLKGTQPPSSTMPAVKGPTPEMDQWVQTNLAFYRGFNKTYYSLKATMAATQAAHSTKASECQTKATAASGKYCTWFDEVTLFKSAYATCRSENVLLYNKTLAASLSNMKGRKADYSALMKVECYLKVLLDAAGMAATKFTACESSVAPDLTPLDIDAPAVPARAETALAGLGSPVDKSCADAATSTTTTTTGCMAGFRKYKGMEGVGTVSRSRATMIFGCGNMCLQDASCVAYDTISLSTCRFYSAVTGMKVGKWAPIQDHYVKCA